MTRGHNFPIFTLTSGIKCLQFALLRQISFLGDKSRTFAILQPKHFAELPGSQNMIHVFQNAHCKIFGGPGWAKL